MYDPQGIERFRLAENPNLLPETQEVKGTKQGGLLANVLKPQNTVKTQDAMGMYSPQNTRVNSNHNLDNFIEENSQSSEFQTKNKVDTQGKLAQTSTKAEQLSEVPISSDEFTGRWLEGNFAHVDTESTMPKWLSALTTTSHSKSNENYQVGQRFKNEGNP